MTDLEKLKKTFDEIGVKYEENENKIFISVFAYYGNTVAYFAFKEDGTFNGVYD